ncbi:hypothetical protein Taro_026465, partial [Colocasia esculenta]|nr:hypothetical protein [Colocasia esculenta]
VIYMGVDDGVFVPPSDITQHGDYIGVPNGVFVPPFDIYRMVFVPPSDNIASTCVVSLTTDDLNEDARSHMTTCGVFSRTRRRGPNAEDRTPKDAKDFLPSTCGLFL